MCSHCVLSSEHIRMCSHDVLSSEHIRMCSHCVLSSYHIRMCSYCVLSLEHITSTMGEHTRSTSNQSCDLCDVSILECVLIVCSHHIILECVLIVCSHSSILHLMQMSTLDLRQTSRATSVMWHSTLNKSVSY